MLEMRKEWMLIAVMLGPVLSSQSEPQQPFEDTMLQLEQLNNDLRQKYRSVGMMDDFSNIVSNMIVSLQEVQTKGEGMVNKINKQESRLEQVITDIEQKEKYIQRVHFEMNQIDEINERIKAELGTLKLLTITLTFILMNFRENSN